MPILKPLHPPPDGDVSRGPALVIVCAVFGAIATVSTALRLGVRAISHKLDCDDLMIAIATALLIVQTVLTGLVFQNGGGRHQYYLKPEEIKPALKWNYITEILLFLIIPFTKISICFFVLRIKNTGWLKWLLYGVIAGLIITTLVPIVILLAQCRPIRAFWDKTAGTCWDPRILNDVNYFQVAYSILSDVICSFLPIPILWKVQMKMRMKIAIWGLMSLGLIATACAAVRMSLFTGDLAADLSWNRALISIWCGLEETLGIICANLALSRFIYTFFAESGWSRKSLYQYNSSRKHLSATTPGFNGSKTMNTTATNKSSISQDTMIPLDESAIRKTVDVDLTSERSVDNMQQAFTREWHEMKSSILHDPV
ncbi:MAG: hypothetical protein MMC23_009817 [Stictis urceolatum]|nr:hypothetical protein [Stictis urceolata]